MKNLLKMGLLGLMITICASSCGDGKKAPGGVDTSVVDSTKKDVTGVKPDTTKADTIKK